MQNLKDWCLQKVKDPHSFTPSILINYEAFLIKCYYCREENVGVELKSKKVI